MPYYQVNFEIVGNCNAKCKWCVTGARNRKGTQPVLSKIAPVDFEIAIDYMLDKGIISKASNIDIFNYGEPLLHPKINEIIDILNKRGLRFGISTNASLVPDALNATTFENLQRLVFSMPGYSYESYERMHGFDFGKVKSNIQLILQTVRNRGFIGSASVSFHLYQYNLKEINPAESFAKDNDMQFFPYAAYFADQQLYYDYISGQMDPVLLKEASSELFLHYIHDIISERPTNFICNQITDILVVDEQLNVITCCAVDRFMDNTVLGSLLDLSFVDIAILKHNAPFCKKCQDTGIDYSLRPMMVSDILGTSIKSSKEIRTVEGNILPSKMHLDGPANQSTLPSCGKLTIHGWCLFGGSVDRIEILYNDTLLGVAQYGCSRSDVLQTFPLYQDTNAGFIYTVNVDRLPKINGEIYIKAIAYSQGIEIASAVSHVFSCYGGHYVVP